MSRTSTARSSAADDTPPTGGLSCGGHRRSCGTLPRAGSMGVFVDELKVWRAGRRQTCHLTADTLDELREFAAGAGIPPQCWHDGARTPHYDLPERGRDLALQHGAVFVPARDQARVRMARRKS